jgi:fucose permease
LTTVDFDISPSPDVPVTEVSFGPSAFASATGAFMLMGAVASLFGPLLEGFSHRFHLSLASAGAAVSVDFVGATVGVLPAWLGLKRLEGRKVLIAALVAVSVGAAGATFSHTWALFLTSVFLIGLGFGGLDIALNTMIARTELRGRARRLSVGNAGYGVGAVICPLIIVWLGPHNFPALFGGLCVLAVVLATLSGSVVAPPVRAEPLQAEITRMKDQRRPILITFVLAFIFYVAIETSASGWMATQLHRVGYSQSLGSVVTAGFWGGMAVGRSLGGPLYHWLAAKKLVLGGLSCAVVLILLALADPLAPYVYPALGLVLASIFPMGFIWYTVLCPHDSDGLSLMMVFMLIGGIAGPGAMSLLVSHFGVHVVPTTLAALTVIDLAIFASALRFRPLVLPSMIDARS